MDTPSSEVSEPSIDINNGNNNVEVEITKDEIKVVESTEVPAEPVTIEQPATPKNENEVKEYSDHLLVLQHGIHGSDNDFNYFKLQIEARYKGLVVLNAKSNATILKTQDGIANSGNRLFNEIMQTVEKFPNLKKISLIGHSLGGRYAVGKLYEAKLFEKLTPIIFMTIASPNVGSRRPMRGTFNKIVSHFTSRFLQRTGMELMLEDETPEGAPLLVLLARKGTIFMEGLSLFQTRVLYSNIKSDVSVPYCTAAIVNKNPYRSGERKITLSKEYPHIIEYEEKEETTLEIGKEDLKAKDLSDELLGDDKSDRERDVTRDSGIWQYSPSAEETTDIDNNNNNNNNNANNSTTTETVNNNDEKDQTKDNTETQEEKKVEEKQQEQEKQKEKEEKEKEKEKEKEAISETKGKDTKNAEIEKETIVEKLFAKDSKGEYLAEILRSLQTLTWKRYDVCFDTWFLAHTHVVVKRTWVNTAGSDVVRHIVDNFTP